MSLDLIFWETLKNAYISDQHTIHMCCIFDDFGKAWQGKGKSEIKQLAIQFLAESTWNCYFSLGAGLPLFDLDESKVFNFNQNPKARAFVLKRAVRSQFIDWVISEKF